MQSYSRDGKQSYMETEGKGVWALIGKAYTHVHGAGREVINPTYLWGRKDCIKHKERGEKRITQMQAEAHSNNKYYSLTHALIFFRIYDIY